MSLKQHYFHMIVITSLLYLMASAPSYSADVPNGIGIYFDSAGTTACMDSVSVYPHVTTAYLILTNYSSSTRVRGWECTITADPSIVLSNVSMYGDALNAGTAPEYSVGLSAPLAPDSVIVLATIDVLAFAPGGLHLGPISSPSIDNATCPIVSSSNSLVPLFTTEYVYGGQNSAVATIGSLDCPTLNVYDSDTADAPGDTLFSPDSSAMVTFWTPPGSITLANPTSMNQVAKCTFSDPRVRDVLTSHNVTHITRAHPSHYGNTPTSTLPNGTVVAHDDLSQYFTIWSASKASANLASDLLLTELIPYAAEPPTFVSNSSISEKPKEPVDHFHKQWSLKNTGQIDGDNNAGDPGYDVSILPAWDIATGSSSVRVGAIESSLDYTHPDLVDRVDLRFDEGHQKTTSHGTSVFGIIGAHNDSSGVRGIDDQCFLILLDTRTEQGFASYANALQNGIDTNLDIINHSYHLEDSDGNIAYDNVEYSQLFYESHQANILNVSASGNTGHDTNDLQIPARYNQSLTVGSINNRGILAHDSTYGPFVDLVAPGHSVYTATLNHDYAHKDGTSFAAPHVTGIAALLKGHAPTLLNDDIANILMLTTNSLPHHTSGQHSDEYGWGLVSAVNALEAITFPNVVQRTIITGNPTFVGNWEPLGEKLVVGFDGYMGLANVECQYLEWTRTIPPVFSDVPKAWITRVYTDIYHDLTDKLYHKNFGASVTVNSANGTYTVGGYRLHLWRVDGSLNSYHPAALSSANFGVSFLGPISDIASDIDDTHSTGSSISCTITPSVFNSSVTATYSLARDSSYELSIYDIRGRAVYETHGRATAEVPFDVKWDARSMTGTLVSSGKYFIVLRTETDLRSDSVTLIK